MYSVNGYICFSEADMKSTTSDTSATYNDRLHEDESMLTSESTLRGVPHFVACRTSLRTLCSRRSRRPASTRTLPSATPVNSKWLSLSLRTANGSCSSGPGATPMNLTSNNSAPGGVRAECSNCGTTHTSLCHGLSDKLNCNTWGLYCKLVSAFRLILHTLWLTISAPERGRPRPKSSHGEGRFQTASRQEGQEVVAQCYNCHTAATPLWHKDGEGKTVCNIRGL